MFLDFDFTDPVTPDLTDIIDQQPKLIEEPKK